MKAISHNMPSVKIKTLILIFSLLVVAASTFAVKAQGEYKLINKVPKHLPIKIEIINEKAEDFLADAEIKVTNTGEKPIYYLKFVISTTKDFRGPSGYQYGFSMRYGRAELITFGVLANDEDVPIKKGESYTFKVERRQVRNFNESLRRSFSSKPEKYLLEFQFLNFGDATGFWTTGGTPFPAEEKKSSLNNDLNNEKDSISFFLTQNQKNLPV